jgi:TM2 domain-containing membrane protein YozV
MSGHDESAERANDGSEATPDAVETDASPTDVDASPSESGRNEQYCSNCGEAISAEAAACPNCGVAQRTALGRDEKSSAVAFLASLIIPGAGQVYNEQIGRGILAFVGAGVADTLIVLLATILTIIIIGPLFFLLIPVVHVAIAYDAYTQAERINRGEIAP